MVKVKVSLEDDLGCYFIIDALAQKHLWVQYPVKLDGRRRTTSELCDQLSVLVETSVCSDGTSAMHQTRGWLEGKHVHSTCVANLVW